MVPGMLALLRVILRAILLALFLGLLAPAAAHSALARIVPRLPPSEITPVYAPRGAWRSNASYGAGAVDVHGAHGVGGIQLGIYRGLPQQLRMDTGVPGANVSLSYWGTDVYFYGEGEGEYELIFDGALAQPVAYEGIIARTGGSPYGFHSAVLVLRNGTLSVAHVSVRHFVGECVPS